MKVYVVAAAAVSLLALTACATPSAQEVVIPVDATVMDALAGESVKVPTNQCEAYQMSTPEEREAGLSASEARARVRMQSQGYVINEATEPCWVIFEQATRAGFAKFCDKAPADYQLLMGAIEAAGFEAQKCYDKASKP